MPVGDLQRTLAPPVLLQARSSDEFRPRPWTLRDRRVLHRAWQRGVAAARGLGAAPGEYFASRSGTAAALLALNEAWGERFVELPDAAAEYPEAAREALSGHEVVIDVQTHYVAAER